MPLSTKTHSPSPLLSPNHLHPSLSPLPTATSGLAIFNTSSTAIPAHTLLLITGSSSSTSISNPPSTTTSASNTLPSPALTLIHHKYRRETCGWCFAYDAGRTWKIRSADPPTGFVFCSERCRGEWEVDVDIGSNVSGSGLGMQAWRAVEGFRRAWKGRRSGDKGRDRGGEERGIGKGGKGGKEGGEEKSEEEKGEEGEEEEEPDLTEVDIQKAWKAVESTAEAVKRARKTGDPAALRNLLATKTALSNDTLSFLTAGVLMLFRERLDLDATNLLPQAQEEVEIEKEEEAQEVVVPWNGVPTTPSKTGTKSNAEMTIISSTHTELSLSNMKLTPTPASASAPEPEPEPELIIPTQSSPPLPPSPQSQPNRTNNIHLTTLSSLYTSPTPYVTLTELHAHTDSYLQLLSCLPEGLLAFVTPANCQRVAGLCFDNAFGIRSLDFQERGLEAEGEGGGRSERDDEGKERENRDLSLAFPYPTTGTERPETGLERPGSELLGHALYPAASLFNHSCRPNVVKARRGRQWMFWSRRMIGVGEEGCITYLGGEEGVEDEDQIEGVGKGEEGIEGGIEGKREGKREVVRENGKGMRREERRRILRLGWGFECACERCLGEEEVLEREKKEG